MRLAATALAPVGVFAFWGGTLLAERRYPTEYDWRYMTISSLLSPNRNPAGYLWGSGGIAACGLCGFCWAAIWIRRTLAVGTRDARRGMRTLQAGYLCMALAGALPEWLLPVPKGHEILAVLAFAGVSYGMLRTFERSVLLRVGGTTGRRRLGAGLLVGAAVLPIVVAAIAQAYVFLERPELPWVSLSWRARGVPVYISFAFWEWLTCLVLSAYMAAVAVVAPMPSGTREYADGPSSTV